MKSYLGVIVSIIGVLAGGYIGFSKYQAKTEEALKNEDWARIQSLYQERVGWIRSNPDEKSYKDEVGTFFRNYFKDVNEHLNRFHGNKEFDDYLVELDKRAEKGGKESQIADKKAHFEFVKKNFDLMRSGNYSPLWTATDKGMRLDIVTSDLQMVAGKPQLKLQLVLWGAQRELREEGRNTKKMATSASFNTTWKLFDDKGKLYGEVNVNGDPTNKVDWPERYVKAFPPQMVLGYFPMDLLPAEVAKVEITFQVSSRAQSGGEAAATYVWKLDTPAEWKLKPGEKWEGASESERPEDEIDPAAAARKQARK